MASVRETRLERLERERDRLRAVAELMNARTGPARKGISVAASYTYVAEDAGLATTEERDRLRQFVDQLLSDGRARRTISAYRGDWLHLARWYRRHAGAPFDLHHFLESEYRTYAGHLSQTYSPATARRRLIFLRRYRAVHLSRSAERDATSPAGPREAGAAVPRTS